jgi:hypothetical protein
LMDGRISRHHNGLRHADSSLDFALHGFFWPNPAADPEEKRGPASDKNWSC